MARFGVAGATLERTAEEAGLARALIRHNVGNKDELLDAFLDHFLGKATEETTALFAALPATNRLPTMIRWLFEPRGPDTEEINVTNALFVAAVERPELATRLRRWSEEFTNRIGIELHSAYPDAEDTRIAAVATGIVGIFFNLDTMSSLGETGRWRQSSEMAANLLVAGLEG